MKKTILRITYLLLLASCASTPPDQLNLLITKGLPGHWYHRKLTFDPNHKGEIDGTLSINCDGEIRYQIEEPEALIFREANDNGYIKNVSQDQLSFRSWTGIAWSESYRGPYQDEKGCPLLSFRGKTFQSARQLDCSLPKATIRDVLIDISNSMRGESPVNFCDQ